METPLPSPRDRVTCEKAWAEFLGIVVDEDETVPQGSKEREVEIENVPSTSYTKRILQETEETPAKRRIVQKGVSRSPSRSRKSPLVGEVQPVDKGSTAGPSTQGGSTQSQDREERAAVKSYAARRSETQRLFNKKK